MGIERLLLARELGPTQNGLSKRSSDSIGAWAEADFVLHNCSAQYANLDRPRSTIASAFCLDGQTLASTHGDHSVKVVNCTTGEMLGTLSGHRRTPWVVRFNPIKTQILASGSLDHAVIVWDSESKQELLTFNFGKPIASVAFHSNGELMAVAAGHRVYTWAYSKPGAPPPVPIMRTRKSLRALHFHPLGRPLMLTAEVVERKTSSPPNADAAATAGPGAAAQDAAAGAAAAPAAGAAAAPANGTAAAILQLDPARQALVERQGRILTQLSLLLQTCNGVSRSEHETLLRCLLYLRHSVLSPPAEELTLTQTAAAVLSGASGQGQHGPMPSDMPVPPAAAAAAASAASLFTTWWNSRFAGATQETAPQARAAATPAANATTPAAPASRAQAAQSPSAQDQAAPPSRGGWFGRGWLGMQRAAEPQVPHSRPGSSSDGMGQPTAASAGEATPTSVVPAPQLHQQQSVHTSSVQPEVGPSTNSTKEATDQPAPDPANLEPTPLSQSLAITSQESGACRGDAHMRVAPAQAAQQSTACAPTADVNLLGLTLDQAWREGTGDGLKLIPILPHTVTGAPAPAVPFDPHWGWEVNPRNAEAAVQTLREQRSLNLSQHFPMPALPEQPCVVNLILWPFNIQKPERPLSNPKLQLPRTIMCSEMGCCISRCGRYLACCMATDTPSAACEAWLQRQAGASSNHTHQPAYMGHQSQSAAAGPSSSTQGSGSKSSQYAMQFAQCHLDETTSHQGGAVQHPVANGSMPGAAGGTPSQNGNAGASGASSYELRIYSLDGPTFGQVLHARPIRAAHCLTSLQFSPTSNHLLVAYGRRHISLCNLLWDSDTAQLAPLHTVVEIYRVEGMDLLRQVAVLSDEVNVAAWHPSPGGGMLYGTKDGKLRLFRHDRRAPERCALPPLEASARLPFPSGATVPDTAAPRVARR